MTTNRSQYAKQVQAALVAKPVPELNIPAALWDHVVKRPMSQEEVEAVCRSLKVASSGVPCGAR